jgi:hypothetical protein
MYVVRLTLPDREPDYKVFEHPEDARRRFLAASPHMPDEITSAVLFHVPEETNARAAVQAVKDGRGSIVDRDHWAEMMRTADEMVAQMLAEGTATRIGPDDT